MKLLVSITPALLLVAAACTEPQVPIGTRSDGDYQVVVDVPPEMRRDLDLLFVVDNTETMAQRQLELSSSFDKLISHLEFAEGGLPNLHVGVVSTDLGAGDAELAGCTPGGDGGALLAQPQAVDCVPGSDAPFLTSYGGADWRDENFGEQHLGEAFSCISQVGTDGCRFEQPLEAMKRALSPDNAWNQGFLRPDAALGVVFLTDEDDCSVIDDGIFDPMLDGTGEVSKFRCFRHGVTCGGDDVRLEGQYEGCEPKQDSDYIAGVDRYADFIDDLKLDPTDVVVTGLIGDASLVQVEVDLDDQPQLVPACQDDTGEVAYPAVRLQHFLDGTRHGGHIESLCKSRKPAGALAGTARKLRRALGTRCLDGDLVDVDPDTAGLQFDCRVYDRTPDGDTDAIPQCPEPFDPEGSTVVPCYAIKTGPAECGDFRPHQLALQVWRGSWNAPQPTGTHTIGECLVDPPDRE